MRHQLLILALACSMALLGSPIGSGLAEPLPHEPGDADLIREEIDGSVGLYFREYSLARNGIVDYRTARQLLFSEPDVQNASGVQAETFPLFYWYDGDQDGQFEMWVDQRVEGCRCDFVRYEPH